MFVDRSSLAHHRRVHAAAWIALLALVGSLFATRAPAPAQAAPAPAGSAPAADGPQFLRDLYDLKGQIYDAGDYVIGGGYLYWWKCEQIIGLAAPDSGTQPTTSGYIGYLRRWPMRGGAVVTLSSQAFCGASGFAADDSGFYYWRDDKIYRRATAAPFAEVIVDTTAQPSGDLAIDNDYIYWIVGDYLYRVPKAATWNPDPRYQSPIDYLGPASAGANSLIVSGDYLYWYGGSRIYRQNKACSNGDECANPPTRAQLAIEYGTFLNGALKTDPLLRRSASPFWVSGLVDNWGFAGNELRAYECTQIFPFSCGADTYYTAPNRDGGAGIIGPMVTDGTYLFWIENVKVYHGYWASTDTGQLMKWKIRRELINDNDPFNTPRPIACKDCHGGSYSISGIPKVGYYDGWVYFQSSNGITRMRADAPPITWDLSADAMEVTQGIQNLNNDVPLVANKPTFVRLYGHLAQGPSVYGINALLTGQRADGSPLPGSPLRPITGVRNLLSGVSTFDRARAADSWIFQLPSSWIGAGTIRLSGSVEPRNPRNEINAGNNARPFVTLTFSRKAPVCLVTIPVRSHGPAARNDDPAVFFARDMVRRLWPVSDVWLYHQDSDIAELQARFGIPPWEYGPYEIPEDSWKIMVSLTERDLFSDDPDECDDAGARTHYIGIISAQTPTVDPANVNRSTNGSGRVGYDQAWVKLPRDNFPELDWRAGRAGTLAHELAHNYERKHVNCDVPDDDDVDNNYPYKAADGTACTLDNRDLNAATTYYGFNGRALEPIAPTAARDLLTYTCNDPGCTPRWISDYSFRGLFNGVPGLAQAGHAPNLAAAGSVVQISGVVTGTVNQGALNYAWVFPGTALSTGMLRKWQQVATPTMAEAHLDDTAGNYHLRLIGVDGSILDDRVVTPVANDLHPDNAPGLDHASPDGTATFTLAFPAPAAAVARVELLNGSDLLASLQPGGGQPSVDIISPAGGESVDSQMTISWQANDPDPGDKLLYTLQYSPDNGATWRALLSSFPNPGDGQSVTLSLSGLDGIPASTTGALIRVAASDGYHTVVSASRPFSVANRAPQPFIDQPTPDRHIAAGATAILSGGAMDAEDGSLSGSALTWALNGATIGSGETQLVGGLAPGSYTITLTARDSAGREGARSVTLIVDPLKVPHGSPPALDGSCDDDAYAAASAVPLAPYGDATQAAALILRTDTQLWVCFPGMPRTGGTSNGSFVTVRIDPNLSRDAAPQGDDFEFKLFESGVPVTTRGDGAGFGNAGPGGSDGRVTASQTAWSAELYIDAGVIGGFNHIVGLMFDHNWVNAPFDDYHWPFTSAWSSPATWGAAALGDTPQLNAISPASAPAGSPDLTLTLDGSGFAPGATALWNGAPLPTTVVNSAQLHVIVPATTLAVGGTTHITVVNPGLESAPSNILSFDVLNPIPGITSANLASTILTITGSNFVSGAIINWNGTTYPATLINSGQLQAQISAADAALGALAEVSVVNPEPGGGVSNVVRPVVGSPPGPAPGGGRVQYLPLVHRR